MIRIEEPKNIIELIKILKENDVPEEQYRQYVNTLIEMKGRRNDLPLTGSFELTPLCNLDCKMCYVHLNANQYKPERLLSVNIWKELIKQAHEAGMMNASLTGGECLTYPGFDEIYTYLYELGIIPGILSNGILIDQKRIDFFKKYPPKTIQITLYGSSEESYEKVTGHRVYKTVLRNLSLLRRENIPVRITITPSKYMETDIHQLIGTIENLRIPYKVNPHLIPPRQTTGRTVQDAAVDSYVEILRTICEVRGDKVNPVELTALPEENHESFEEFGLDCGAGRSSFGITHEGLLCPCLALDNISSEPLSVGFLSAWKQVNTMVKQYPKPEECGGCVYKKRCLHCVAMHKSAPIKGHCDPVICERTKQMIRAGFLPLP